MPDENVQRLRSGYSAFSSGDERAFRELLHPDFQYRSREELPGGGAYEGRDAFFRRLAELRELFVDILVEPDDIVVAGEYIVAPVHWSAQGRGGGVRVAQDVVHVWRMRGGRASELLVFSDKATALETVAVRLAEATPGESG
jgi:ketosteroid isomerase-like protein